MPDAPLLRPRAVPHGGRLAIIAPASPFPLDAFEAGLDELRRLGFEPTYEAGVFDRRGYVAGEAAARARALMDVFEDPGVAAIVAARGGYGSVDLLPFLSVDGIRRHPKLLVGYSDITALLAFLTTRCGVVALHGPCVAAGLHGGPSSYDPSTFEIGDQPKNAVPTSADGRDYGNGRRDRFHLLHQNLGSRSPGS